MTIACEPFASDGVGMIDVDGDAEVFMLKRDVRPKDGLPAAVEKALQQSQGLPFARRDLERWLGVAKAGEDALRLLRRKDLVDEYPPLCEKPGVRIAQFEHTIFIGESGAEVLTRLPE
jgi:methionyl aminopeptidase